MLQNTEKLIDEILMSWANPKIMLTISYDDTLKSKVLTIVNATAGFSIPFNRVTGISIGPKVVEINTEHYMVTIYKSVNQIIHTGL